MATAPTPAKGGNVLTRKVGPLPGWAWAGIAVGGIWYWRKRQAAATAAATPATTSTAPVTPGAQAPTGYGYQGPGVGMGGSGQIPTGAVAATATPYTPPTGETELAAGYSGPPGAATVTDSQGNVYIGIPNQATATGIVASGGTIYWQPTPGTFVAAPGGNLPTGAEGFQLTQPAAAPVTA